MLDRLIVRGTDKGFCRKIDLIIWIPFYPSYVLMLYIRYNQNIYMYCATETGCIIIQNMYWQDFILHITFENLIVEVLSETR